MWYCDIRKVSNFISTLAQLVDKSIIYDDTLYYKSKHLPPRYDKRSYNFGRSYFQLNKKIHYLNKSITYDDDGLSAIY